MKRPEIFDIASGEGAGTALALEKVSAGARRMAVSPAQVYREAKAGRLILVKTGARSSALVSSSVDAWIASRIAEASTGRAA